MLDILGYGLVAYVVAEAVGFYFLWRLWKRGKPGGESAEMD